MTGEGGVKRSREIVDCGWHSLACLLKRKGDATCGDGIPVDLAVKHTQFDILLCGKGLLDESNPFFILRFQ